MDASRHVRQLGALTKTRLAGIGVSINFFMVSEVKEAIMLCNAKPRGWICKERQERL